MRIFSQNLIYAPTTPQVQGYEAYRISIDPNSTTDNIIPIIEKLGDITDVSKTFISQDESNPTSAYVFDGDLYVGDSRITTSGKVTAHSGYYASSNYSFFIEDGKLMRLKYDTLETLQIGEDTTWSQVCGYTSTSTFSRNRAFGVCSSGLYRIDASSVTLVSSITNWTKIVGMGRSNSTSYYGLGISDGKLYYLYANGDGAIQQGEDTTWTDITGTNSASRGVNNGSVYQLDSTITAAGNATNVIKVSGWVGDISSGLPYVLCSDGKLYSGGAGSVYSVVTQGVLNCSGSTVPSGGSNRQRYQGGIVKAPGLYVYSTVGFPLISGEVVYVGGTATTNNQYIIAVIKKPTPSPPSNRYRVYWLTTNGTPKEIGYTGDISKTFCSDNNIPTFANYYFVYEGNLYYQDNTNSEVIYNGGDVTCYSSPQATGYYMFFIAGGKLYSHIHPSGGIATTTQIGVDTDWVKVSGQSTSSSGTYRCFAEKSDGLYMLDSTSATKISDLTGWTQIIGNGRTNSATYYGYGINNGKLYFLYANGNGVVQRGEDTTWTQICGYRYDSNTFGFGINNGALYRLDNLTQIGTDTTWTKISGAINASYQALGINDGKLYSLSGTATQIGTDTDWVDCTGSTYYGMALKSNGEIYYVNSSSKAFLIKNNVVYIGGKLYGGMIIEDLQGV